MLERQIIVAVGQMCSTPDANANLEQAISLVREGASRGADLVALPEDTVYLGPKHSREAHAEALDGASVSRFAALARELSVCILVGSIVEVNEAGSAFNTSVLLDREGALVASYRKIHLFDVETPDGHVLQESRVVTGGTDPVVVQLGAWSMGLTICYDLRFPELYRRLVDAGATLMTVPSAFTAETGRDHWHTLLQARAIENLACVVAPNQWGSHTKGRRSYGRSAIIGPWGTVLACASDGVGVAVAKLDLDEVERRRERFPCLAHRRVDDSTIVATD